MHVRRKLPNQDAVATRPLSGGGLVAAVADGHGGERYVRSDVGSRIAVEVACEIAAEWWSGAAGIADRRRRTSSMEQELSPALVAAWRGAVLAHAAANPFTAEERSIAAADVDVDPALSYGATVLFAVADGDTLALAQLGDGDVTVVSVDGRVLTPIAGDERLVAGQTTSLCLPTAAKDVRVAILEHAADIEIVVLSTDGYGNAFADAAWQSTVANDLQRELRHGDISGIEGRLPGWLAESAEVGGDDVTVAILARRASAVTAQTAAAPVPTADRGAPRWSSIALGAAGVTGLVLGLVAGLLLGSDDGKAPAPIASTTTSVVPSPASTVVPTAVEIYIGGEGGSLIGLVPEPQDPRPRLLAPAGADRVQGWTTSLDVGETTYDVDDGVLRRNGDRLDLGQGFEAGSLHFASGYLWVIDVASARVVPLDAATGELAGEVFLIEP